MYSVRLLGLLAVGLFAADGFRFSFQPKCGKITNPLCSRVLPYNLTRFPNIFGHQSEFIANRAIQLFSPLVKQANCSKHAEFFLCSFYLPICLPGIEEENVIRPCRSLCERIKADCSAVIQYWPSFVKCEELPQFKDSVCIQPESFIAEPKPTKIVNVAPCESRPPADYRFYASGQYDYAMKFKVILIEKRENQETIFHGKAAKVYKQGYVPIHKGRVEIWSYTNSTCPSLRAGRAFLIGGHEDALRKKLLLSSTSLIEAWSGETMRKVRKWLRIESKLAMQKNRNSVPNKEIREKL